MEKIAGPRLNRQSSLEEASVLAEKHEQQLLASRGILEELDHDNFQKQLHVAVSTSDEDDDKVGPPQLQRTHSNNMIVCAVCGDQHVPRLTKICDNGTPCCYQCLRSFMVSLIKRRQAPECPCRDCGKLDILAMPYSFLLKTLCPMCYIPDTQGVEHRVPPTVVSGCALGHAFCAKCARSHVVDAIKFGRQLPGCPRYAECRYTYEEADIKRILDETQVEDDVAGPGELLRQWHNLRVKLTQKNHPQGLPCSRPDCDGYVLNSADSTTKSTESRRGRCTKCEFLYCVTCMNAYHPNAKTCDQAQDVYRQWVGFLNALVDQEGGANDDAAAGTGVAAARGALEKIHQKMLSNQYFRTLFGMPRDAEIGMKFCPGCHKVIEKVGACPSMVCGKNNDNSKNNQSGCGKSFTWRDVPCATEEEIDQWLVKQSDVKFATVTLNTTDSQYDALPGSAVRSKDGVWSKIDCTQCYMPINGTRFECLQCGGDSGRPAATLCLGCVTQHTADTWGTTAHSGHAFSVLNPTGAPVPALRFLRGQYSKEFNTLQVCDLGALFADRDENERGGVPLVTACVELHPDGRLVYADSAARAIGSVYLDSISFKTEQGKRTSAAKVNLAHPDAVRNVPARKPKLTTTPGLTMKLNGLVEVQRDRLYVPPALVPGSHYRLQILTKAASEPHQKRSSAHSHTLASCDRRTGWNCDGCRKSGTREMGRFRCTDGCDFDLCGKCMNDTEVKDDEGGFIVAEKCAKEVYLRSKMGKSLTKRDKKDDETIELSDDLKSMVKESILTYDQAVAMMPKEDKKDKPPAEDVDADNLDPGYVQQASVWEVETVLGTDHVRLHSVQYPGLYLCAMDKKKASIVQLASMGDASIPEKKRFEFIPKLIEATNDITLSSAFYGRSHSLHLPHIVSQRGNTFKQGDLVKIRKVSISEAKKLQDGFGGWGDSMADLMGKTGAVESLRRDGELVKVFDKVWNPAFVEFAESVCMEGEAPHVLIDTKGTGLSGKKYCGAACSVDHDGSAICARCNDRWGVHNGHTCHRSGGGRGSFPLKSNESALLYNTVRVECVKNVPFKTSDLIPGVGSVDLLKLPRTVDHTASDDAPLLILSVAGTNKLSLDHACLKSVAAGKTDGIIKSLRLSDDAEAMGKTPVQINVGGMIAELHGRIRKKDGHFHLGWTFTKELDGVKTGLCQRFLVPASDSQRPGAVGTAIVDCSNGALVFAGVTADSRIQRVDEVTLSGVSICLKGFVDREHRMLQGSAAWPAKTVRGKDCKGCLSKGQGLFCAAHKVGSDLKEGEEEDVILLREFYGTGVKPGKSKRDVHGELAHDYVTDGCVYWKDGYCFLSGRVVREAPSGSKRLVGGGFDVFHEDAYKIIEYMREKVILEKGCGPNCSSRHDVDDTSKCLRCGRDWNNHSGHNCSGGKRGSWAIKKSDLVGTWSPGDVIARLPRQCRPKSKCTFAVLATAAPAWPEEGAQGGQASGSGSDSD
jgi:hypothetical protein